MSQNPTCYYDDLTGDKPVSVTAPWVTIIIRNLQKGEFYVAPLFFHASKDRPLRVEIMTAGSGSTVEKAFEFTVGRQLNIKGNDTWLKKRYKLNKARHDGTARIRVGWDHDHPKNPTNGTPFTVAAGGLESKGIVKRQRIDQGLCPVCGKPGVWQAMAMVCDEHGVFLG